MNIYDLFMKEPPVITDREGNPIRHRGASFRNAFWTGVDGIKGGYPKGSWGDLAWRAGRDSRDLNLPAE